MSHALTRLGLAFAAAMWLVVPSAAAASRCRVRHTTPVSRLHITRSSPGSRLGGLTGRGSGIPTALRRSRQYFNLRFQRGRIRPPQVGGRSLTDRQQRTRLRSARFSLDRQFRRAATTQFTTSRQRLHTVFHPCP